MITNITFSAYCACTVCCGPNATGLAANGKPPTAGVTVAASRAIPLGTKLRLHIPSHPFFHGKTVVVTDRLAKRYDHRVDIYFKRHRDARKFGLHRGGFTVVSGGNRR